MPQGSSLPLTVTNIVLAVLVVGAVLYVFTGPLREMLSRMRKPRAYEAELTHDMEEMFPSRSRAALAAPPAPPGSARAILSALRRVIPARRRR